MQVEQFQIGNGSGTSFSSKLGKNAQLVFVFGGKHRILEKSNLTLIHKTYPNSIIIGCTTAGEIFDTKVLDDSLVVTAVYFEHTKIFGATLCLDEIPDSYLAGKELACKIPKENLRHIFVLSDGLKVNGTELVKGLTENAPKGVTITGGLAGDGDRFKETFVVCNELNPSHGIVAVGFYGERLKVGYASLGGWDSFGPERVVTKSVGNVLYEMDGQSALELYKKYLGEHAKGLPATGLLFPLSLRLKESEHPVVRTILSVDENSQSMTFAGDIPEGSYARLMKANFDRLIDGAEGAAKNSIKPMGGTRPDLAILISCVGRKLVLKQRVEEEVEHVRDVFGNKTILTGFYSYGEISPFTPNARCELHNQTMTITTFAE